MLSKSKFILGQQCVKSFWFDVNNVKPTNPPDEGAKERLSAGNEVGDISKKLFPDGQEVPYLPGKEKKMAEITQQLIEKGITSIYEGSFIHNGIFVRVDLMNKTDKGWDIYEVKSSSKVRSYHEYDASIQWHVLKNLNSFLLNEVFIVTLNTKYTREKDICPIEFFNINSVTKIAEKNQVQIEKQIRVLKKIASSQEEPSLKIGAHCKKPHNCVYLNKCWPANMFQDDSIFNFYRLKLQKKLMLFNEGRDTFSKIETVESFSPIQQLQLEAYKTNAPVVNKEKIKTFIKKIKYPISFFDFETFTDAVPVYEKQRAHMQMPFQYSLHIQNHKKMEIKINENHYEFIADHKNDPRRSIAESLIKHIPKQGTIMAYNESFEKGCIKSLASYCPDLEEDLLSLNDRFVDLIEPFRGGGYYDSKFKGSFSIKKVLPALCPDDPELDYKKLDINNGGMAMTAFKDIRDDPSIIDIEERRRQLSQYCRLDTYAMYAIFRQLTLIL